MTDLKDIHPFEQLVEKMDPHNKLLRAWTLEGGVSAQVTAIEIEGADSQLIKLIVRQHGEADRSRNPHIAADEFRLLTLLQSAGLTTPRPHYLDTSSTIFATPCIVIEYIEGEIVFAPTDLNDYLFQFATHLSRIHHLDCSTVDVSFLPKQAARCAEALSERSAALDEALDEGHIRAILEAAWPLAERNPAVLLHGDYWPGNIVWKDDQLVGVIDWEDAALGDPLADIAYARLEMLWTFGSAAMDQFTRDYQSMTHFDFTDLPYWDLFAALRSGFEIAEWAANNPGDIGETAMREGYQRFIAQAFEKLSGSPRP